jgi:tRNA dimethylallyltransferase
MSAVDEAAETESGTPAGSPLLGVIGATASGKTALAVELCRRLVDHNLIGEVVSLDSMLVYRGLDVGTAKPDMGERQGVPHHLIDHVDPGGRYDVASYVADAAAAEVDCRGRGVQPLFCGGTAFYLQALLFGLPDSPPVDEALRERLNRAYDDGGPEASHAALVRVDPELAARVHPNDKKRVVRGLEVFEQTGHALSARERSWSPADQLRPARLVLLESAVDELDERIRARTRAMFDAGWPEEAASLWDTLGKTARAALGYADARAVALGELEREVAIERIALATRRFARRQRTWLRRFEGLGIVRAFDAPRTHEDLERIASEALGYLLELPPSG